MPQDLLTRRQWLAGAAAAATTLALGRRARAIGPASKFRFGVLSLGAPLPHPSGLRRLAWELDKRTAIDVDLDAPVVTPTSDKLHETPFVYLAGDREIALPDQAGLDGIRRFLTFGGFLLIDSAEGSTDGAFDHSVRRLMETVFPPPGAGFELIAPDHVVYKSFYLLDQPVGRLAIAPAMEGIVRDGRLVVAYVQNDLAGAWSRDNFGNYDFPCEPGGERQRELAFRMGINLVMYALCLDYKTDQVHVPFIMRRRRWKPDDGATPAPKPGGGPPKVGP
jgi:Domain of unknown function (DUF4159)